MIRDDFDRGLLLNWLATTWIYAFFQPGSLRILIEILVRCLTFHRFWLTSRRNFSCKKILCGMEKQKLEGGYDAFLFLIHIMRIMLEIILDGCLFRFVFFAF